MVANIITTILTIIGVTAITALSKPQKNRWDDYSEDWVSKLPLNWKTITAFTAATTTIALTVINVLVDVQPSHIIALGITIGLLPVVLVTDFSQYKIPATLSIRAYYAALLAPVVHVTTERGDQGLLGSIGSTFIPIAVALILPFALIFVRSIGFGDVRLLILFSVAYSWWGYGLIGHFGYSLIVSALLGMIVYVTAAVTKKGRIVEVPKVKMSTLAKRKKADVETKKRRATPFGPSLMVGYISVAITSLIVAVN